MSIIVQKYGGSSLATPAHIEAVARRILEAREAGDDIVVVVSAMGSATSDLLGLAGEVADDPDPRELDVLLSTGECVSMSLLCMALKRLGADAVSLSGAQGGIRTSGDHFNAEIEQVDPARVRAELAAGRIVVVAGYQGEGPEQDVTTLGIGGSDITAVALAAALGAARCEICSDVDGVYSADPRVVDDAYRLDEISYAEMIELARHGASVLNPRAVTHARRHGVEIRACSTFEPEAGGTVIRDLSHDGEPRVVGVASHDAVLPVVVHGRGAEARELGDAVLDRLGKDDVFLDHTDDAARRRELLIPADDVADPDAFARRVRQAFGDRVDVEPERGSVSAVGLGVGEADALKSDSRTHSERAGIRLHGDYSGEHSFTCVVPPKQVERTVNVLHERLATESES